MAKTEKQHEARDLRTVKLDASFDEVRRALQAALDDRYPSTEENRVSVWVEDVFDTTVIYYLEGELWRVGYTYEDDKATLVGKPERVRKSYEPLSGAADGQLVQAFTDDSGRLILALDIPQGEDPPTEFRLFGQGITRTTKGDVLFDEQAASDVTAALADHGKTELPVDYGHGMLSVVTTPDSGKAAAWFKPAIRSGELWASDVQWTPKANEAIRAREYRFFSPAVWHNKETRRVSRLVNVALTNLPATKGQQPLVASDNHNDAPGKGALETADMSDKLLRVLGAADEAEAMIMLKENERTYKDAFSALGITALADIVPAIKALSDERDATKAKLTAAEEQSTKLAATVAERETELSELKKADETRAHEALIGELTEAGKLTPGLKDWAKSISLEALQKFGEAAVAVKPDASTPNPGATGTFTITPEMRKIATATGLDVTKFAEQQTADDARMAQLLSERAGG